MGKTVLNQGLTQLGTSKVVINLIKNVKKTEYKWLEPFNTFHVTDFNNAHLEK